MLPIFLIGNGEKVRISRIDGGKLLNQRLNSLGLMVGSVCEIVNSGKNNSGIIISKDNSKIGLGFGMAAKIFVEKI